MSPHVRLIAHVVLLTFTLLFVVIGGSNNSNSNSSKSNNSSSSSSNSTTDQSNAELLPGSGAVAKTASSVATSGDVERTVAPLLEGLSPDDFNPVLGWYAKLTRL